MQTLPHLDQKSSTWDEPIRCVWFAKCPVWEIRMRTISSYIFEAWQVKMFWEVGNEQTAIQSHGTWLTWNVLPRQFVCFRSEIGSSWQITHVRPLSVPNGLTSPSLKRLHKIWEENMEQVWQIFSARKTFLIVHLDDDDSVINNNDVGWQRCLLEHLSN